MRFVNTTTLKFEDVDDSELEKTRYAVLSHRWLGRADEILFEDVLHSTEVLIKKGYAKFEGFCALAKAQDCKYAWLDTCCINKSDLTELSEAINSMYRWYGLSATCIAYLVDVPPGGRMMGSEWFERGWTLQELISPQNLSFYDQEWNFLGTKTEFLSELSAKTNIPENVLNHKVKPSSCSIAQRMSWAANRVTTRPEDRAYSLLGLFEMSMTMIYGERERAFTRLQQQLMLRSKDESLFAWAMDDKEDAPFYAGLLAPSPSAFDGCAHYYSTSGSTGFSEKNGLLVIQLKTLPFGMETYLAALECTTSTMSDQKIAILIRRHPTAPDEYVRVRTQENKSRFRLSNSKLDQGDTRQVCIPVDPVEQPLNVTYGFWLRTLQTPGYKQFLAPTILSRSQISNSEYICLEETQSGTAGVVRFDPQKPSKAFGWSTIRWLKFGFDTEFNPLLLLANGQHAYYSRFGLNPQTLKDAIKNGSNSREHESIMGNTWIGLEAGVPSREYGWPMGVAVIKGDRKSGLNCRLGSLNLDISIRLVPDPNPAVSSQQLTAKSNASGQTLRPREVWAVDITEVETTSSPENDHRCADFELCMSGVVGFFAVFTGCPCLYLSFGQGIRHRRAMREHTTVLTG